MGSLFIKKGRSVICMDLQEWDLEWDGDGLLV